MVVALITWIALALLLGTVLGRAIHRADVISFPERDEHARWDVTRPAPILAAASERPAAASERPLAAATRG